MAAWDGRQRYDWWHTSTLLAMLHNVNRDPRSRPAMPSQYDPFAPKPKPKKGDGFGAMRAIFCPGTLPADTMMTFNNDGSLSVPEMPLPAGGAASA